MTIRIVSLVSLLFLMMCGLCACATSDPQKQPNSDMTTTVMTTVATTTTADNTTAMNNNTTTTAMFADTPTAITAEQAQTIALEDAGLTREDVTRLYAELEYDDGRQYYDVQFYQGTVEYDYEIDAATGAIIEKDRDIDM